jgi:hypothetical protein
MAGRRYSRAAAGAATADEREAGADRAGGKDKKVFITVWLTDTLFLRKNMV